MDNLQLQSDQIEELAKALVEAQKTLGLVRKDSTNPFFKSDYATLEAVIMATRGPLTDNGLAITQTMLPGDIIVTTLLHVSGQWLRSYLQIKPIKNDPQGVGSAITYGRRYARAAICGVTQADDDAEAAVIQLEPKMKFSLFVEKVKAEIDQTLTDSVIAEKLKDKGFKWETSDKVEMFNYLRGE